jgi:DNA-binding transcriptional regulator YiaG
MTGEEIKLARKMLGMTQAKFAERLDVHRITVSRWERGVRKPYGAEVKAIELLVDKEAK